MKLPDDVTSIFAIVVGVEGYGPGIGHLRGPARDALTVAQRLLGLEVPPGQILVFHNLAQDAGAEHRKDCDDLAQQLKARGVQMRGEPTRAQLEALLTSVPALQALGARPGSLLWLYWSGHGIMNLVRQQRYLVTGDAQLGELNAINIDWVCAQLRTHPKLVQFSRQLVMVDACSAWSPRGSAPRALEPDLPGAAPQAIEQDRVFASLNGDTARIEKGQSLSLFTQTLLGLLAPCKLPGLDLDDLWDELKQQTDRSDQPCLIDRIDPRGRPGRATGGRAADLRERTAQLAAIAEGKHGLPLSKLQRLFRSATGCEDTGLVPASTHELVWALDEMTPCAGIATRNSEWFAILLEAEVGRLLADQLPAERRAELQALRQALAAWLEACDQAALTQDRARLAASAATTPVLFVDLGQDAIRVWINQGRWRFVTTVPATADMAGGLADAWSAAIEADFVSKDCHLELAVDLDALPSLPLGTALGARRTPRRIGFELPFSVRLRDRWVDRELLNNWLQAYQVGQTVMDLNVQLDWLDLRPGGNWDSAAAPNSWLCVHDMSAPRWLDCLQGHLEQGAPWALACSVGPTDAVRLDIGTRAGRHTLRESARVARAMAEMARSGTADPARVVVLADRPDNLPPGAMDQLSQPAG